LRGQRKGWVGAEPGQMIKALIRAKSSNPVIVLDEIDKICGSQASQIQAALLEILDPNQNREFRDAYLDVPVDLSKVMFIATANYVGGISLPLWNRMEVIRIEPYTPEEKQTIAKTFIMPELYQNSGITPEELNIDDEVIAKIINAFKYDAGMRRISQTLNTIIQKYLVEKLRGALSSPKDGDTYRITLTNIESYAPHLETPEAQFDPSVSVIGQVNVLFVNVDGSNSILGGGNSFLQVRVFSGSGKKIFTGNLSNVIKETIEVDIGYIHSHLAEFGIAEDYFNTHDIHLHQPELALHKDGPSAGLATTIGLLSAIKNLPVPQNIGMTGEMDLSGNAMIIGGVKGKVTGSFHRGITRFVLPQANKLEFDRDVPDDVKQNIEVHFISNISEAIPVFFPDWKIEWKT
jgi:ATP-dependent Lon protease